MSYTVYAKLSDGRTLRYGKKLNTIAEVNSAMAELKSDLKEAGVQAKVSYKNDNPTPKAAPRKTAAKGIGKTGLSANIRTWYHKTYPTDEAYEDINAKGTFRDVVKALINGRDVYVYCGDDSIIRERVFQELCNILKTDYDTIYDAWMKDRAALTKLEGLAGGAVPKTVPRKAAPRKAAGPDPLDGNLKEAVAKGKGRYAANLAEKIKPNVTIRQVIDSINKDGDTFKLITGEPLKISSNGRSISWSRSDEMLIDAVCVAVARPLKRKAYDVKHEWNYLGDRGNKLKYGKGEKKPLTVKEKEKVNVDPSDLPKIGDIFMTYGNFHTFYIITERKGTMMYRLVKIGNKVVKDIDGYGQVVMVVPDPTQKYPDRGGNEWKKYNAKTKSFKLHSGWFGNVYPWNGQPVNNDYLD